MKDLVQRCYDREDNYIIILLYFLYQLLNVSLSISKSALFNQQLFIANELILLESMHKDVYGKLHSCFPHFKSDLLTMDHI